MKKQDAKCVILDASAVLAMLLAEPGGAKVDTLIDSTTTPVGISAVNLCEVLTRMQRGAKIIDNAEVVKSLGRVYVYAFQSEDAVEAAEIHKMNPELSLGDRACMALARRLNACAWTSDRIWKNLKKPIQIYFIR